MGEIADLRGRVGANAYNVPRKEKVSDFIQLKSEKIAPGTLYMSTKITRFVRHPNSPKMMLCGRFHIIHVLLVQPSLSAQTLNPLRNHPFNLKMGRGGMGFFGVKTSFLASLQTKNKKSPKKQ